MNAKVNITNRAGASFPVRRMNFDFNDVPEYWMNGSAGLTHFMTALSALFPAGEKFFIDSVRAVRYHPAIKAFIGQEMHTQEHVNFNAFIWSRGRCILPVKLLQIAFYDARNLAHDCCKLLEKFDR